MSRSVANKQAEQLSLMAAAASSLRASAILMFAEASDFCAEVGLRVGREDDALPQKNSCRAENKNKHHCAVSMAEVMAGALNGSTLP